MTATPDEQGQAAGSGAPDAAPAGEDALVEVTALQAFRWRIGRRFTPEPTLLPLSGLVPWELDALRADPMLVVVLHPPAAS